MVRTKGYLTMKKGIKIAFKISLLCLLINKLLLTSVYGNDCGHEAKMEFEQKHQSELILIEAYVVNYKLCEGTCNGKREIEEEKNWTGSGFFISVNGHLLTGAHVIPEFKKWDEVTLTGKIGKVSGSSHPYKLQFIDKNTNLDLALLKLELEINKEDPNFIKVATLGRTSNVLAQKPVWVMGYPGGRALNTECMSIHTTIAEKGNFGLSGNINKGQSGGPVFDTGGAVIGVLRGGFKGLNELGVMIPINHSAGLFILTKPPW